MRRPTEPAASKAWFLAVVAVALDLAIPLLPFYGDGAHFVFDIGFPARDLASYLLGQWTSVLVILVGIGLASRSRLGLSAGVFLAVGLDVSVFVVRQVLVAGDALDTWQSVVVTAMSAAEAVLLLLAAGALWRATVADRVAPSDRPAPLG